MIKTKTCVLIEEETGKALAIGHQAEKIFTEEMETKNESNLFFKDFKLSLYNKVNYIHIYLTFISLTVYKFKLNFICCFI